MPLSPGVTVEAATGQDRVRVGKGMFGCLGLWGHQDHDWRAVWELLSHQRLQNFFSHTHNQLTTTSVHPSIHLMCTLHTIRHIPHLPTHTYTNAHPLTHRHIHLHINTHMYTCHPCVDTHSRPYIYRHLHVYTCRHS